MSPFPTASLRSAVLWMSGALASFASMALAGRELSVELSVFQILFFRSLVCLAVILMLLSRSGWHLIRTSSLRLHVARNATHFAGQYGWFYGISMIPLAEVFALEFTTPLWTAAFAAMFLGERVTRLRATALALGFLGILVLLRPGLAIVNPAALAVLAGAMGFAATYVMTKRLTETDRPLTILFYMNLIQLPLGLAPAWSEWVTPSVSLWPWVILLGLAGLGSHYCLTRALAHADATIVVPLDFLRLPLIAVVGYLAYREPLDPMVFLGAGLIFASSYINVRAAARALVSGTSNLGTSTARPTGKCPDRGREH